MRTADIAKRYLDYFAKHDHLVMPSASLISPNPTTLFTIAGMVPFIPYLLGEQRGGVRGNKGRRRHDEMVVLGEVIEVSLGDVRSAHERMNSL